VKKEDFIIYNNRIEIKDNVIFKYYIRKYKDIEVEGKTYRREWTEEVKQTYKEFQNERNYDKFEKRKIKFELLNKEYIIPNPPYFLKWRFKGSSENNYASLLQYYSNFNFFKNIKSIYTGKKDRKTWFDDEIKRKWQTLWKTYKVKEGKFIKDEYVKYKKPKITTFDYSKWNQDFSIHHYDIGWNNEIYYNINLYFILTLDYERILEHAEYLIRFFEYYGIDLKENYDNKLKKLLRVKEMIIKQNLSDAKQKVQEIENENNLDYSLVQDISKPNQVCYIMKNKRNNLYKIGVSNNPKYRERTLQSEEPEIELIKVFKSNIENQLHRDYSKYRVRGEWFNLNKIQVKHLCKYYDRNN
jgi:hypothetical protein